MTQSEREELAKFRERKKKASAYNQKYEKENYRRMVCTYPIGFSDQIDKAMELSNVTSVSGYISSLITKDLKEKGLVD